jgi:hypothetical protein
MICLDFFTILGKWTLNVTRTVVLSNCNFYKSLPGRKIKQLSHSKEEQMYSVINRSHSSITSSAGEADNDNARDYGWQQQSTAGIP